MRNNDFLVIIYLLLPLLILCSSCGEHSHEVNSAEAVTYTCPMHPQVVQNKAGTCPICGMDLVVFDRSGKNDLITLNKSQMALANISTVIVGDTNVITTKKLNGRVVTDAEGSSIVSSRVAGRIEKLYYKETGTLIEKGKPLYAIYSEELASLQQEYLLAVAQVKEFPEDEQFRRIERAAYRKLLLFGQSESQVQQLISSNKPSAFTTYNSPLTGVIAEIVATEGGYVNEGGIIMRLQDYNSIWVEADVYPADRAAVRQGMQVNVETGASTAVQKMKIEFVNPDLADGTQVTKIRGKIDNTKFSLLPGMQASIIIPITGNNGAKSLPTDAVIRNSKGAHVWVETAAGKFQPRNVTLGKENAQEVEITNGLNTGDKVVTTGAYLIYSEFVLKKGTQPALNHQH